LSTTGSISFGIAFVAGRNLVPKPPTGKIAFLIVINPPVFGHTATVLALKTIRVHKDRVKKSKQEFCDVRLPNS
jgi:hypothetical protein